MSNTASTRPGFLVRLREGGPRAILMQLALVAAVVGALVYLVVNARAALQAQGMTSGFGFLTQATSFSMGEGYFNFTPSDSYLRAFAAAIGNTIVISAVSILTASALGALIGVAALARNPILRGVAQSYVYLFRNTPQLLQIIFWYSFFALLPPVRDAWSLGFGIFASNRGLTLPAPENGSVLTLMLIVLVAAFGVSTLVMRKLRERVDLAMSPRSLGLLRAAMVLGPVLIVWLAAGAPRGWSVPELGRFNYTGGATLAPEFMALYFGLSFYIAAFIAEIVRGGVQSVDAGQIEAARTVGLSEGQIMVRVVAPQALRIIIPPLAAQYISLLKNSSLGVAVGYPELFSVANTSLTYSGRTIEVLVLMAGTYLLISLCVGLGAAFINRLTQYPSR
ncbi:MAG: ABC transporter permease subunit [Rhodobacteraceae bacterium]|nr:ABC transporter permease subunit [Paracoccaceae bacterium]